MGVLKRLFLIAFFSFSFIIFSRVFFLETYPDFSVYYSGSKTFFFGENPYIARPGFFSNYVYPPFVLLLILPFTLLPIYAASVFFVFLSIISLFLGVYFCLKALKAFTITTYLLTLSFCMLSFPAKFTLGMGQVNLILFCLLSLAIYFINIKKQKLAGCFLGFCFAIKLFPLLLLPYFVFQKQWKLLISSAFTIILLYVVAAAATGVNLQIFFLQNVLPGIGTSYQSAYYNQALSGFFARLPIEREVGEQLKIITSLVFVVISLFILFRSRKKKKLQNIAFSFIITLSLLVNPFSWQHHFVWLIFPFIATFFSLGKKNKSYIFFVVTSYLLISLNIAVPDKVFLLFQSHVLFGTILLWLVQAKILIEKK